MLLGQPLPVDPVASFSAELIQRLAATADCGVVGPRLTAGWVVDQRSASGWLRGVNEGRGEHAAGLMKR